ncbi:putative glycolipid-binding domain-containing protein [Roseovarius sp. 2305UL8-3]|uniref:putative glycolipid-binding domain-containing protein n=1 Tax=Roseovarius conchicola TaxID=3121636 RepID=UPI00352731F6
MPGQTIAEARWRALDREGEDKCRLSRVEDGWLLIGHARFHDGDGFAALDYVVRCDADWYTLSADIAGTHAEKDIRLTLHRDGDRWMMNDQIQPQVSGARDVDLAFTPATNLMPLRRLHKADDHSLTTRAAWLRYPSCVLSALDQTYTGTSSEIVSYAAQQTAYATQLCVDQSGFVTLYPGLWEGEVHRAS